jgi:hypothetical protein
MKKLLIGLLVVGSVTAFAGKTTHTVVLSLGEVGFAVTTKGNLRLSCGPNPDQAFNDVRELEVGESIKLKVGYDMYSYDESGNAVKLVRGDRLIFKCQ